VVVVWGGFWLGAGVCGSRVVCALVCPPAVCGRCACLRCGWIDSVVFTSACWSGCRRTVRRQAWRRLVVRLVFGFRLGFHGLEYERSCWWWCAGLQCGWIDSVVWGGLGGPVPPVGLFHGCGVLWQMRGGGCLICSIVRFVQSVGHVGQQVCGDRWRWRGREGGPPR